MSKNNKKPDPRVAFLALAYTISRLPLEDWITEDFKRVCGDQKSAKKIMRAALELKRTVEEVQAGVLAGKVKP